MLPAQASGLALVTEAYIALSKYVPPGMKAPIPSVAIIGRPLVAIGVKHTVNSSPSDTVSVLTFRVAKVSACGM